MIIRRKHNSNYTVIGNDALSDERQSFAALGLLCYLRRRPNGSCKTGSLTSEGGRS